MTSWEEATAGYLTWLAAGGAAASTRRIRRYYVGRLAQAVDCGPWQVAMGDLLRTLATPGWAAETRKSARSSFRSFYGWATECGHIAMNPAAKLPSVRVPRGVPRPTPLPVVRAALEQADARDRRMILLARLAGLRRSEVARCHTRDVTPDLFGHSLTVHGKGGNVRSVPLHTTLAHDLLSLPSGFVFPGRIDGHLSPGYVGKRLAALLGPGWSGHTLRHRFATDAYAVERDLYAVQQLLGHASSATTARYTQVPRDSLRTAVNGLPWAA